MPRNSLQALAARRLSEADRVKDRFLDLQIDFVDERDNTLLGRLGGRWDRLRKAYVDDAARSRVVRLHQGQIEFADWFLNWWLDRHYRGLDPGDEPISTALAAGGRRSGKSTACTWLQCGYAVAVPGSINWIVFPSDVETRGREVRAYIEELLPRAWYCSYLVPKWRYDFANGSYIRMISAHLPSNVKQGKADTVFINEAQQVKPAAYGHASASVVDTGGIVLCAANPPNDGDHGRWVSDIAARCANGTMKSAKSFFVDPLMNPHIDQRVLEALREKYSPHDFEIEVRGRFLVPSDTVLHAWDRTVNERRAPDLGACTPTFCQTHEGQRYRKIVSVDVQKYPWLVACIFDAYPNPEAPSDMRDAILWLVGEVYIERGDEIDLARALKQTLDPETTLVICDASGRWQQAERKQIAQRAEFRGGAGSWDMFRAEGFTHIVGPDRDMQKNPDVVDRVRAANARIGNAARAAKVFADPEKCPRTVASITEWRTNGYGHPGRTGQHAHAGDALTYAIWRFFPRRWNDPDAGQFESLSRYRGQRRVRGYV